MTSLVALAKRALVAALKSVARSYGVRVDLTGESPDAAVRSAYRRVVLRAHQDKGGSGEQLLRGRMASSFGEGRERRGLKVRRRRGTARDIAVG